jgi:hypothetical protein
MVVRSSGVMSTMGSALLRAAAATSAAPRSRSTRIEYPPGCGLHLASRSVIQLLTGCRPARLGSSVTWSSRSSTAKSRPGEYLVGDEATGKRWCSTRAATWRSTPHAHRERAGRSGLAHSRPAGAHYPHITVNGLPQLLDRGAISLLDVRGPQRVTGRTCAQRAVHHRCGPSRPDRRGAAEWAARRHIGSGYRSSVAASLLARHGHPDAFNVTGWMAAWHNAGYPVEQGQPSTPPSPDLEP